MSANERDKMDSYTYSGIIYRDNRHSHDGPEVTGPPRKKRNNKACKKNKNKPHEPGEWEEQPHNWAVKKCIHCGKHLEFDWRFGNFNVRSEVQSDESL